MCDNLWTQWDIFTADVTRLFNRRIFTHKPITIIEYINLWSVNKFRDFI